jgi:hypothetical protein
VKLAGACSVRMRHSSSRKIMSIIQCRLQPFVTLYQTALRHLLARLDIRAAMDDG